MKGNEFDFPCSYSFRNYEAWINEGITFPPIEPAKNNRIEQLETRIGELEDRRDSPPKLQLSPNNRNKQEKKRRWKGFDV
jgi:hypothetical protein